MKYLGAIIGIFAYSWFMYLLLQMLGFEIDVWKGMSFGLASYILAFIVMTVSGALQPDK